MRLGLKPNGRFALFQGAVDIGQGSNTVIAQICADALGAPIGPDRSRVGGHRRYAGLRQNLRLATDLRFRQRRSARGARDEARTPASRERRRGCEAALSKPASVAIADAAGERRIELAALPVNAAGFVVEVVETFDPPTTPLDENGQGDPYAVFGSGAHMAEIEVDVELGRVKVLRLVCAHDVGRAINPTLVEGQIEGGAAQGLGLALMEEFFPGKGENLHDYLIPTIGDMPPVECILIEDASSVGPFGAKGIGEQALDPDRAGDLQRHPSRDWRAYPARAGDPGPCAPSHPRRGWKPQHDRGRRQDPLRRLSGPVLHPAGHDGRLRPLRESGRPIGAGRSACAARPRR